MQVKSSENIKTNHLLIIHKIKCLYLFIIIIIMIHLSIIKRFDITFNI